MEQRERFGAACLALCLRHDARFCRQFLSELCGIKSASRRWNVYVDRYHQGWADILVESSTHCVVIECKVGDGFAPKQDPWNGNAFIAPRKGYGWYFKREFPLLERHYLLLGATRVNTPKTIDGIRCRTAVWADVARLASHRNQWLRDLYASLANLDYPAFRDMKTDHLRLRSVLEILQCHEVLNAVARKLGVADPKITHTTETDDASSGAIVGGYVGIEISSFKKAQTKKSEIKSLISAPSKYVAWFGYEMDPSLAGTSATVLSVWLYCGNLSSEKWVRKSLDAVAGWKLSTNEKATKPSEKHFLRFTSSSSQKNDGDVQRFLALLGTIIPAT